MPVQCRECDGEDMTYLVIEIALWLVLAAIIGGGVGWWLKSISVRRGTDAGSTDAPGIGGAADV
ncbi:MAG: hypothetical protein ACI9MR_003255 [Myxococcota bacterium]|jgi:hypothetical protein